MRQIVLILLSLTKRRAVLCFSLDSFVLWMVSNLIGYIVVPMRSVFIFMEKICVVLYMLFILLVNYFLKCPRCGIFLLGNRSIRNRWRYNRTLTIFRSHHKSGIVLGSLMIPICSVLGDACRKRTTNCGWRLCCG